MNDICLEEARTSPTTALEMVFVGKSIIETIAALNSPLPFASNNLYAPNCKKSKLNFYHTLRCDIA